MAKLVSMKSFEERKGCNNWHANLQNGLFHVPTAKLRNKPSARDVFNSHLQESFEQIPGEVGDIDPPVAVAVRSAVPVAEAIPEPAVRDAVKLKKEARAVQRQKLGPGRSLPPHRRWMGVVGDWIRGGGAGARPGSPGSGQYRRCLPASAPGGKGTTSWVRGLVAPRGYRHLDLGV
ncbi:hypothetical protein ATANTOWER_011711 [Ataeniobius toweri]|uniref:Uncharacterized protein n=1 Tax=Ataeniobius toweri TaxID=208326 RepID=A0ABU7AEX7_9TELE|nr:hypothetical protein [Ataeniobius toweri]